MVREPTRMEEDGPVQEEYLDLVREEVVLKTRLARVEQKKRALEQYLYEAGGAPVPRTHAP
eukprot:10247073-Prorocentrum_lima.AAC.1